MVNRGQSPESADQPLDANNPGAAVVADQGQAHNRRALAQKLHDGPLQSLAAAMILFDVAAETDPIDPVLIGKIRDSVLRSNEELRSVVHDLRRADRASHVLVALEFFATDLLSAVGSDLTIHDGTNHSTVHPDVSEALTAIGREAVLNVARHSGASSVTIDLRSSETSIALTVADDGRGFTAGLSTNRLGVVGMMKRAEEVGGAVSVNSSEQSGTAIRAVLPL